METVCMMERYHERALPYGKEKIDGKMTWKDERIAKAERDGAYLVRDEVTITVDGKVRAGYANV